MKKGLILCFVMILMMMVACGPAAENDSNILETIKKRGKLVVGVKYDTYLFGYKDPKDQQVKGFEVDLMKEFAKYLLGDEKKVEFKEVTSKTRIKLLDSKDVDVVAATMTITEQRKKQIDFTNVYFLAGQSLLVKKGSGIKGLNDLKGKVVSTAKGATSGRNIKNLQPAVRVEEYENYADALTALKSGKVDAVTTDDSILFGMEQQNPDLEVVGGQFTKEPYGMGVHKDHKELTKELNKFLGEIKRNGKYDQLYRKWFRREPPKEIPKAN